MTLDLGTITQRAASHALATGRFSKVNRHEPKAVPGPGINAAVWVQEVAPYKAGSGLACTSARVTLQVRIYSPMLTEPQDEIDPTAVAAMDDLMRAYSADFDLGGLVRNVDLLGASGEPLSARAGYLNQDGKLMRVIDISLPLIISDLWEQSP